MNSLSSLIVCLIIGTCIALAIPAFDGFQSKIRLEAYTRTLALDLNYARLEAIKTNQNVFICPSDNMQSCSDTAQFGYLIGFESNQKLNILRVKQVSRFHLNWASALNEKKFVFTPQGVCPYQGSISISNHLSQADIVITHSGRVRYQIKPLAV